MMTILLLFLIAVALNLHLGSALRSSSTCPSSLFAKPFLKKLRPIYASTDGSAIPPADFKTKLSADMKDAMKSKQKERLAAIRAIQTAIKQKEVDERINVDEAEAIAIMTKLVKQRKESIKSYADSGRQDLVDAEEAELKYISEYLPAQMSTEEVEKMIDETIARLDATTIKDMGKVMAELRSALTGKADTSEVGTIVKKKLGGK